MYVGVEVFFLCDGLVFLLEDGDDFFLVGFDLGHLAVRDEEGIWAVVHSGQYINSGDSLSEAALNECSEYSLRERSDAALNPMKEVH